VAVAFGFGEKEDTWWNMVRTIWEEDGEDEEGEKEFQHGKLCCPKIGNNLLTKKS